ncbi:hypothetical protein Tco_1108073 [Tanacetum coccineum]
MNATIPKPNIPSNNIVAPNMEQVDSFTMVRRKSSKPRKFEGVCEIRNLKIDLPETAVVGSSVKTRNPFDVLSELDVGQKGNNETVEVDQVQLLNKVPLTTTSSLNVPTLVDLGKKVNEVRKDTLDDDHDPYDDDEYAGHDFSDDQHAICDA